MISFQVTLQIHRPKWQYWCAAVSLSRCRVRSPGKKCFQQLENLYSGSKYTKSTGLVCETNITCVQILMSAANQFCMRYLSVYAARNMHEGMLHCLVRAPMSFFHSNPSGRIINRLTKDTSDIDNNLAAYASMTFQTVLQLVTTAILIGAITPFVLPLLVPVLLTFYMLYQYFQASVREVKRLDALSRSPIFSCVSDAINVRVVLSAFSFRTKSTHLCGTLSSLVSAMLSTCVPSSVLFISNQIDAPSLSPIFLYVSDTITLLAAMSIVDPLCLWMI